MIPAWCLSRLRAEEIARELEAIHPRVGARVLYSYGTGGYVVVVDSPERSQDEVAVVSEAAYKVLLAMRADAWRKLWRPRGGARPEQMGRTDLWQVSRLRASEAAETARTGYEPEEEK